MSIYEHHLRDSKPSVANAATPALLSSCDVDDLRLISRIAHHDHEAFDLLYKRYAPRLASFLFPLSQDLALVDEVTNDVMLVVWQKARQFRPSTRPSTWIFGIARKKALKMFKTATRQGPHWIDATTDQVGPEAVCIQQQQAQIVTQAVRTLPPRLRDVVEGLYYLTLTYPELANRLGCSVSTVKNRLDSARRRLAVQLRQGPRKPVGSHQTGGCNDHEGANVRLATGRNR